MAVLGGLVTVLTVGLAVLAHRAATRAATEDRKVVLTGALRNLKVGYEQASLARFFLASNLTAATFIESQIPA